MIIYWLMLFWVLLISSMWEMKPKQVLVEDNIYEYRANWFIASLTFLFIICIIGLRSGIADTWVYIMKFERLPNVFTEIQINENSKEWGFTFFTVFIRKFISKDFHFWLFIIATISGIATLIPLRKYSINFMLSAFLFVASCDFSWMLNGMRQYLAVSVIFACTGLMVEKKFVKYILVVLLMSTFHATALICIPIYFIVQGKAWNKKTIIYIVGIVVILFFTQQFAGVLELMLEDTGYTGITKQFSEDDGANIIRAIIAGIPMMLAFIKRKHIEKYTSPIINICINMSVVTTGIYFVSSFTSGILIGRLPIYFELYNWLLLPWVINKGFNKKERLLIFYLIFLFYVAFFYYQMVIAWNGLGYQSDILKLKIW